MKPLEFLKNMDPIAFLITVIFILFIIVIAGSVFFKLWLRAKELDKDINEAIQRLPKEDHKNEFTKKYHKINDYFSNQLNTFSYLWKEFTEQLIKPSGKEQISKDEQVFQNSVRSEKFFTLEDLLKKRNINLKTVEFIPGFLVGIGVLGTFFGLTYSLLAVDFQNSEQIKNSIDTLISGAGTAFLTSLAGLTCSILFNYFSDKKIFGLQKKLDDFNSTLEKSLKFVTSEQLLSYQLKELKQQDKYLENMDENIATKIGNHIEGMEKRIQSSIAKSNQNISEKFILDAFNQMAPQLKNFSKNQTENLEKILTSLQQDIPALTSHLMNSQKQSEEAMKNLIDHLASSSKNNQIQINDSLVESMNQMKSEFGTITQNLKQGMTQTISDSSNKINELLTHLGEMNQNILEQTEQSKLDYQQKLKQTTNDLQSFVTNLKEVVSEINTTTTSKIKELIQDFHETLQQQKQIASKNEIYVNTLDKLSNKLTDMSFSVSETIEKLPIFIQKINTSNESIQEIWNNYEKRFKNVDESTEQLFEKIVEGLKLVSYQSAEHITKLVQQSAKVSQNFAQAIEELKEAIEELKSEEKEKLANPK